MDIETFKPTVLDVLSVDLCCREILSHLDVAEIVRTERISRRWQQIILGYLQTRCNIALKIIKTVFKCNDSFVYITGHKRVVDVLCCPLPMLRMVLKKLGPAVVSLTTNQSAEEFSEIIISNCSQLKHLSFNSVFFTKSSSESDLNDILRNKNWNDIIFQLSNLSGHFLKFINSSNLNSLSFTHCSKLEFDHLLSNAYRLRNVTKLEFDGNSVEVFLKLNILLKHMPKVRDLSLCEYFQAGEELSEEFIECFGEMRDLKCLVMENNSFVSSALLDRLARGCEKLEHLNIAFRQWNHEENREMLEKRAREIEAFIMKRGQITSISLGPLLCFYAGEELDLVIDVWQPILSLCSRIVDDVDTCQKADDLKTYPLQIRSDHKLRIVLFRDMTRSRF